MKLTEHITYDEGCHSYTAKRLGIKNIPSQYQMWNMVILGTEIFEPLREWAGGPIKINSFFRSIELNKAIGGSLKSQHCEGRAIDIDDVYGHKTNAEMFNYIKENLDYDQLIWEFGDDKNPAWIHVSFVEEDSNRKNNLRAYKENGKTIYKTI
jgi:zinc D-Ala-D-Ala carboxypeptidase